jgi:hypothetical protein
MTNEAAKASSASIQESLQNVVNIFASPVEAFKNLAQRPSALVPCIILFFGWVIFWNAYYGNVDYPWLLDQIIEQETYNMGSNEKELTTKNIENLKPGAFTIITSISTLLVLGLLILITSFYLTVVSAIVDDQYRFKHWVSFATWTSMPSLLALIGMSVNFFTAVNGQIAPHELNLLSLNNLFFNIDFHSAYFNLLNAYDLTILWSWAIMILGYHTWTQKSLLRSAVIVMIPSCIFYGIWLLTIVI